MRTRLLILLVAALEAACAETPSTLERLDESTGVTVRQMARPLEFQSPDPQGPDSLWYAFFGALEVNRMGALNRYAWLSVLPGGLQATRQANTGKLHLEVVTDGHPVELEFVTNTPGVIGLSRTPYRRPAEWARDGYFTVSLEQLRSMRNAIRLSLEVDDGSGKERTYELFDADLASLRAFVDRLE